MSKNVLQIEISHALGSYDMATLPYSSVLSVATADPTAHIFILKSACRSVRMDLHELPGQE